MAILDIVIYPNTVLRTKSEPILEITEEIKELAYNMIETMYHAPGIGLAANQVGVAKRLIVVDVTSEEEKLSDPNHKPFILINPEIVQTEGEINYEEGCLSIPDIREMVARHNKITVKGLNIDGEEMTIDAEGLLAVCFQHEIDHIDGVLFIDHLTFLKKQIIQNKLQKLAKKKNAK